MVAKLLIVDDHVLVREGIVRLLGETEGIDVVGEASDGWEAVTKARDLQPSLILMDLFLPKMSGIEATRLIKREMPTVDIVVLTASDLEEDIYQAVTAGAKGYVIKTTNHADLVRQIRQALEGEVAMSPAIFAKLASSLSHRNDAAAGGETPLHEHLTERETEVLEHVGHGARNKEIAEALSISNNTVRAHVRSIMRKLDVDNRAQLAAYAVRHGLIPGDIRPPLTSRRLA